MTNASASADDETGRLASEATALFHVVMSAEPAAHRCQFGVDWMNEAIPEFIARKFLGLTLHADLASPFQTVDFENALDPSRKQPDAFCDPIASKAYEDAQLDQFEKDKSARTIRIERTAFTFPVFDATYRKAIVIVARSGIERDRLATQPGQTRPGDIVRHPGYLAEVANVYAKTDDGWKLVASELIEQS